MGDSKKPARGTKFHKEKPSLNIETALSGLVRPNSCEQERVKYHLLPDQYTPSEASVTTPPPISSKNSARLLATRCQSDQASSVPSENRARQLLREFQGRLVDSYGRRLIATTLFEDTESLDDSHFENTSPEDTRREESRPEEILTEDTQLIETQFDCSGVPDEMASSRFSTFVDPRFSRIPEQHPFRSYVRKEAREQQAVIHKRLEAAGEPIPPYEWLEFIGKGSFGRVYVAQDLQAQRPVSIKVLDIDASDYKANTVNRDMGLDDLFKEYQVLKQLQGLKAENVNQVLDVLVVHSQIWIITEYIPGGSVHTLMQATNHKVEEQYLRIIARELAKGLRAIHKADVIHRDIKGVRGLAGNVMVHEKGAIEIIDFGVAGQLKSAVDKRKTFIGTPHWMSPEILEDADVAYGKEVDTWSYGCTLIEMATGGAPNNRLLPHLLPKRLRLQGGPKLKVQDGYSEELCDLVSFVLVLDPKKRPTMDEILEHPYLRGTEHEYPTRLLADFVGRHERWLATGGQRMSLVQPYGAEPAEYHEDPSTTDEWRFSTLGTTGMMEELDFDSSLNTPYGSIHIDPIADMTSTQAEEDTMNSYFAGEPSDDVSENFSNSAYTPDPSPRSLLDGSNAISAQVGAPNGNKAQRGGHHLGAIFDTNIPDYTSPALQKRISKSKQDETQHRSSDLPLRSQNASSTDLHRSDTETSSQGSLRSGKKVSNIDTDKANRYARPVTMEWTFPQAEAAASSTLPSVPTLQSESSGTSHPNLSEWTAGYESDIASSPSRPPLRHAETAPVPRDLTRGSRLDMDALMGDLGDDVPDYAYAPPQIQSDSEAAYPVTTQETNHGGLDLNTMMEELGPLDGPYHDGSTSVDADLVTTSHQTFPMPAYPSAEAMAEGASEATLEADLARMVGNWSLGLEALGTQFEEYLDDDYESTDGEGNESE